jgi:hypothetical protein
MNLPCFLEICQVRLSQLMSIDRERLSARRFLRRTWQADRCSQPNRIVPPFFAKEVSELLFFC